MPCKGIARSDKVLPTLMIAPPVSLSCGAAGGHPRGRQTDPAGRARDHDHLLFKIF
jgi:hypothetical protein